jgi:hypothetical protein
LPIKLKAILISLQHNKGAAFYPQQAVFFSGAAFVSGTQQALVAFSASMISSGLPENVCASSIV